MKKYCCLFAIVGIVAFYFTCTQDVAGTNDETSGGIIASLYYKDGTPANNAIVKIFEVSDTSKQPAYTALTDNKGAYKVESIKVGTYNVWGAKDTLVAYQGSVLFTKTSSNLKDDTLENGGSITGIVGVQPNHDPRTVTVQILGSEITADNVDIGGRFTLPQLACGSYKLRLTTTLPEYTPTYHIIQKIVSAADTLTDTLWLIYTGIPVVTGLTAICDTLNGIIKLKWNKTGYLNFQDYALFKDPADSGNMTDKPFGFTADTFYIDTVFGDMNDINDYKLKYRAAVRNNSQNIGLTYKYISITAASPTKVQTTISARIISKSTGDEKDTVSTKDTALIIADFSNPTRSYKKTTWSIGDPDSIVSTQDITSIKPEGSDTLVFTKTIEGDYKLYITVEDMAGTKWFDTVLVPVWNLPEPITFFVDSIFGYSAYLRWTKNRDSDFKEYRLYYIQNPKDVNEVLFDTIFTNANDTAVVITGLIPDSIKYCFFIVVENTKGLKSTSNELFDTTLDLWKTKQAPARMFGSGSVAVNDKIYFVGGANDIPPSGVRDVQEYNLKTETWITKAQMPTNRFGLNCSVVNSKIYAIGGARVVVNNYPPLATNEEYDPVSDIWKTKTPFPTKRGGTVSCAVNDKIYLIGGALQDSITMEMTYFSTNEEYDPATDSWKLKSAMPSNRNASSACAVNGKIYVFGGYGILYKKRQTEGYLSTVEEYNPTTDTWMTKASLPTIKGPACSCVINGRILVFGYKNFTGSNDECFMEIYNPLNDTWEKSIKIVKQSGSKPIGCCVEVNNKVYLYGSISNAGTIENNFEEYTPSK